MVMQGETIATGAKTFCEDCLQTLTLQVLLSAGGYYIGTQCDCGPYSRESKYYSSVSEAEIDLANNQYEARE